MTLLRRDAKQPDSMRGHYAGFVTRYIAFLVDVLLIAAVAFILVSVTRITLDFFGLTALIDQVKLRLGFSGDRAALGSALRWFTTLAGSFIIFGIYSIVSWMLVGKTVGKALMGLRVLSRNGARLTFKQALVRSAGYYISAIVLLLGFLWVLVDDRRQGWHDKMARSFVVYEWDARYEERYVHALDRFRAVRAQRQAAREAARNKTREAEPGGQVGHG